jgi:hypothetical protein
MEGVEFVGIKRKDNCLQRLGAIQLIVRVESAVRLDR